MVNRNNNNKRMVVYSNPTPRGRSTNMPKRKPARFLSTADHESLDASARAYAHMLVDPCNAPMAHPVYPGSEGGYLIRTNGFTNIADGGAENSGVLHWTPGAMSTANTELISMSSVTTAGAVAMSTTVDAPGKVFLGLNASSVRCVAACVEVSYLGTELDRRGRVSWDHTVSSLISNGEVVSANNITTSLSKGGRTPDSDIMITWLPNETDQEFKDPNSPTGAASGGSSITVSATGLPPGAGLYFRLTAVYEYRPSIGLGVTVPPPMMGASRNTFSQIYKFISKHRNAFFSATGHLIRPALVKLLGSPAAVASTALALR